jgi:formylglycine-generating enzyme required for sulfatase activity
VRLTVLALACVGTVLAQAPAELDWSRLRASADNSARSLLIRDIPRTGIDPEIVIRRLRVEPDASARRALLLVLGGYEHDRLTPAQRAALVPLLRQWLETDPDAGVHSAIQWLFRARNFGPPPSPTPRPASASRWLVTAEGHTMARMDGPLSVTMGAPPGERGRQPASDSPDEPVHDVRIPRAFAVSTTEVTVAQFRRFLDATPDAQRAYDGFTSGRTRMAEILARFSPTDDSPAIAVTWYDAAMYCNWLSAREGLPASEWVYPTGPLGNGMRLPADYLQRTGYRLPTEAEWEYAARAGTRTARFFGESPDLLGEYAWFARNPPRTKDDPVDPNDPQRTAPVGTLRPNDLGLFDVYGNVWEWTQDRVERHQPGAPTEDREDSVLQVHDQDARTRRGGAYPYPAAMARSAARGTVSSLPTTRRDNVGFRIARTLR